MKHVIVLCSFNHLEIQEDINEGFERGYELAGDMKVTFDASVNDILFCQVLIKDGI